MVMAAGLVIVGCGFFFIAGMLWLADRTEQLRRRGSMEVAIPPPFGRRALGPIHALDALYRVRIPASDSATRNVATALRIFLPLYSFLLLPGWILLLAET